MEQLHEKVLVTIFKFLTPNDLLSLSLVCKSFNHLISTNANLLDRLELKFYEHNLLTEWSLTRKYTKVAVSSFFFIYFQPMLIQIKDDITTMTFTDFNSTQGVYIEPPVLEAIKDLLHETKNLKNLTIGFQGTIGFQPWDRQIFNKEPRLKLNLDCLKITCPDMYFRMFFKCQVKKLAYEPLFFEIAEHFGAFLMQQTALEDLTISRSLRAPYFEVSEVEFRLKKLELGSVMRRELADFVKFLKLHKKSLEHFKTECVDVEIFKALTTFENLRMLAIDYEYHNEVPDVILPQVESLSLRNFPQSAAAKFPNLKHLELIGSEDCFGVSELRHLKSMCV
jgi:hypothetical protein